MIHTEVRTSTGWRYTNSTAGGVRQNGSQNLCSKHHTQNTCTHIHRSGTAHHLVYGLCCAPLTLCIRFALNLLLATSTYRSVMQRRGSLRAQGVLCITLR
jgi:hypothetical protein